MALNFNIQVEPALSLADTRITAQAIGPKIVGTPLDNDGLYRVLLEWVKANRPHSTFDYYAADWVPMRLRVVNDRVAPRIELQPIAVGHRVIDNSDSDIDQEASVDFSAEVTSEVSIGTSVDVTAGVSFTASVEVGSEFAKASASTTYSVSTTVGHSKTESQSFSVSTSEGTKVTVPPYQIALIVGIVSKGILTFDVDIGFRPEDYAHVQVGTKNASGTKRADNLTGKDLAPYCGSVRPSDVLSLRLPFASEVTSKVVAPLPDTQPATVANAIQNAVNEYNLEYQLTPYENRSTIC